MALTVKTETPTHIPLTYHRVVSVNAVSNTQNIIEVASYISQDTRAEEQAAIESGSAMDVYIFTQYYTAPYDADMSITGAYEWLRNNVADYAGADDVLDDGNSALAYACALADGRITRGDIPSDTLDMVDAITINDRPDDDHEWKMQIIPTYAIKWTQITE
jgi:hypothetical protein